MLTDIAVVQQKQNARRQVLISLFAACVTFAAYTCVYAYRKPFTVATFEGNSFGGIPYQSLLIIAQGVGYMLSKFFGIKIISELKRQGRWKAIALLVFVSWMALLGFAITPAPYAVIFLLINGFPLGFLWGIVFSYIEGRRSTDLIGAAMAVSFIFAGGFTRFVAKYLLVEWQVSENWMPFITGLIFCLPVAFFVYLLERIPPPDIQDINERTERAPMTGSARKQFLKFFGVGVLSVTIAYVFLTLMRDIRDNFMSNIWSDLGYGSDYAIFATSETRTSILILLIMACIVVIRKNIQAYRVIHWIIIGGLALTGISSLLFSAGHLQGYLWMQLAGLGLYMAYIPFNCMFFERLIATFKVTGNVGFLMYFADAFGYLGSLVVMCGKAWFKFNLNWTGVFTELSIVASVVGVGCMLVSLYYFNRKYRYQNEMSSTEKEKSISF